MAIYHLSAVIHSRSKGHSAVAGAAYRSRSAIGDERTGEQHDYSRNAADVLFEGMYAPKDAPDWTRDRAQLWNHVEEFEKRRDAQLCRSFDIALPHELTLEQNRRLLQDWVRENFTRKGLIADVAIHGPHRQRDHELSGSADPRNIHAHVAVVLRKLDGAEFAAKKERTANNDERKAELEAQRASWEKLANRHLERAGLDVRIDRRTLKEQGIAQEPTIHLGAAATAKERREPGSSDRSDINRDIEERNARLRERAALEVAATRAQAELAAARQLEAMERQFGAASSRIGEPAAPIHDREAAEAAWQRDLIDAAARQAEQEARAAARGRTDDTHAPSAARPASRMESRIADIAEQAARLGATILEDANGRRVDRVEALADYFRPVDERQTHTVTVQGREAFAARLDEAGIAIVRVTEADMTALAALREQEGFDRASGLAHKPRHFANVVVGDLAAVTREGNVHRINPDKLSDAKQFLDPAAALPGVIDTRARFEVEGEKITALWDQRRAAGAEARQDFAAQRESQAQHAETVRDVGQFNQDIGDAVDTGARATSRFLRGFGRIFESVIGWLADSIAPPPPPSPEQAERMARSASEQQEARAEQAAEAGREEQHWLIIEAQKKAKEREEAESEQDRAYRRERDRGYEREL
jgi:hypothetical protein